MSGLYFKVGADFDNLKRLKQELDEMKSKLMSMEKAADPKAFNELNKEVQKTQKIFNSLAEEASKAGVKFENDFKQRIYDSSTAVNGLSNKIIEQKSIVQAIKTDVDSLAQSYKNLSNSDPRKKDALNELNSAKKTLVEEKNALFDLQQQQAKAKLSTKELSDEYKHFYGSSQKAAQGTDMFSSSIKSMLLKIGGTAALVKLGKDIINTRSEFQQLEISFGTMLKSGEKAKDLINGLSDFAARTPFGLQSAASAAKQLIAYGSEAGSVIQELTMLGDVAAGTGQQIGDLIYLYGTLRTQGRAYMMDIRQFAGRGIPIYKELATVLNTTEDQVNDFVSAGKVGFEQVEQAFKNMTSAGGMYGGLMEQQSKALTGQIEALKDNIQMMFNEIGQSSEGVVGGAISTAAMLVENYDKVGKVVLGLVATYGTYRTALAINIVINKGFVTSLTELKGRILATQKAQSLLNTTLLKNPYVAMATIVVALATAMWALYDGTTALEKAQKRLTELTKDFNQSIEAEKVNIDILFGRLRNAKEGTEAYQKAKDNIINKYGNYLNGLNEEIRSLKDVEGAYKAISDAARQSAKDRAFEKGTQSAADNYTEQWGKSIENIRKSFNKEFGEAQGTLLLDSLKESLDSGVELTKEVQEAIKAFDHTIREGTQSNTTNFVEEQIEGIRKFKSILDIEIKEIEDKYGNLSKKEDQPVEAFDDITEKAADARKAINNLKKEIADLRSGNTKVKEGTLVKTIEDKTKELQEAEKRLELLTGTDKKSIKETTDANKLKSQTADRLREIEEMRKAISQKEKEGELELQQERLNLMEEGTEKTLAQISLDHEKREAEIIKKGEELIKTQKELERKLWEAENPDWESKGMVFTPTTNTISDLPKELQNYLAGLFKANNDAEDKATADHIKSMLKQFQDYATQRLDLEKEFNDNVKNLNELRDGTNDKEIDAAINQAKKLYQEGLSSINLEEFKDEIDWSVVFGELDKVSTNALYSLRDKLKAYISEVGSSLTSEDMKEIMDAFSNLDFKIAERNPLGELSDSLKKYKKSAEDVAIARKKLNDLEALGYDREEDLKEVTDELSDAQKRRRESLTQMTKAVNEIGARGSELVNAGQDIIDTLITLGVSIPESLQGTINGLGKIMSGLESIDLTKPFSIISATTGIISGIATTVSSFFGMGDDTPKLLKQIERYEELIGMYDKLIDKQKAYLSSLTGADAVKQADEVENLIRRQEEYERKKLEAWFGTKQNKKGRSWGYRLNRDLEEELRAAGIGDIRDVLSFDVDKWLNIQSNYDLWEKLPEEVRAYGEAVIGAKEDTDALGEALRESITGITFSELRDSLDDIVKVANLSFEDVADSFEDHMSKAIMNVIKKSFLDQELMSWYTNLEEAMKAGTLTEEQVNKLRDQYQYAAEEANRQFKDAMDIAGIDISKPEAENVSDNSLKGAYAKASQESIDLLAGQTGAARVALEDIKQYAASLATKGIEINQKEINSILDGIFIVKDLFIQEYQQIRGINSQILSSNNSILDNTNKIVSTTDTISRGVGGLVTSSEFGEVSRSNYEVLGKVADNTKASTSRLNETLSVKIKGGL